MQLELTESEAALIERALDALYWAAETHIENSEAAGIDVSAPKREQARIADLLARIAEA